MKRRHLLAAGALLTTPRVARAQAARPVKFVSGVLHGFPLFYNLRRA